MSLLLRRMRAVCGLSAATALLVGLPVLPASADFISQCNCADAFTYGVLFSGNSHQLSIANDTVNGNIGVGAGGSVAFSGPGTINGVLNFNDSNTGQYSNSNGSNVGPTAVNYNVTQVGTDLAALAALSTALTGESGTSLAVSTGNGVTQTVNATSGNLVNGSYVFTVSSWSTNNGGTLDIQGAPGTEVVINVPSTINFQLNGAITLTGGLTPDDVLFNLQGGTVQAAANGATEQGDFLDINGNYQLSHTNFNGRLFGGSTNNFQLVSNTNLTAPSVPGPAIGTGLPGLVLLGAGLLLARRLRRRQDGTESTSTLADA